MAGLGFKDFQVGEVLTSADVDGYLMQQSVMRFADAGARGSALGTAVGTGVPLAEGMVTYLDDVDRVDLYSGTAWVPASNLVQIQYASFTTDFTTTSTTYVDVTGASVSITPVSGSHNLTIIFTANTQLVGAFDRNTPQRILRNSTAIFEATEQSIGATYGPFQTNPMIFTEAATDTTARTYKIQANVSVAGPTLQYNNGHLMVMEWKP